MELRIFIAQDLSGGLIPNPTVSLYLTGNTTPVSGLEDANGSPLSTPFTGSPLGQIQVAAPDGEYDLRVIGFGRDFTQQVVFFDKQPSAVAILRADLASTEAGKGAEMVMFKHPGLPSAIPRTIQDKLVETVSVKDFGAVGDGITDDTAAIQAAITAYAGWKIYFPSGSYLVSAPIVVTADGTILCGDGRTCSKLIRGGDYEENLYGNNTVVFAHPDATTQEEGGVIGAGTIYRVGVFGLAFQSTVQMQTVGAHVYMHAVKDMILKDVHLLNGDQALHFRSVVDSFVDDVHIYADHNLMSNTRGGETSAVVLSFSRGTFKNNTILFGKIFVACTYPPSHTKGYAHNLVVESADGVWFGESYFGGAADTNVKICPRVSDASSITAAQANKVVGLFMDGVWLDYADGVLIENDNEYATIRHVSMGGLTCYGLQGYGTNAIVLNADRAEDIAISGNSRFHDFARCGVDYKKGRRVKIDGLSVRSCNLDNADGVGCININDDNSEFGPEYFSITNCSLGWNVAGELALTKRGIVIGENCDSFRIDDNDLTGNQSAGLFNGSTSAAVKKISRNIGYVTESKGFVTITAGSTSWPINHGLDVTPLGCDIRVVMLNQPTNNVGDIWISNITSTQFTINLRNAPGNGLNVRWKVDAGE